MSEPLILTERDGAVMRLTLNRPEAANSIDVPSARALLDAAIACEEDDSVRCVLLTGAGRMFSAGGDLAYFGTAGDKVGPLLKETTTLFHAAVSRFTRMSKPMVNAINGPAAGGGMSLALIADVVIAAESAHFTVAYGMIGAVFDGGGSWFLPRLIGLRRTQELYLTNRRVGAKEAAEMGMITRVAPDAELAAQASETARQLSSLSNFAVGRTRQLLLASYGADLEVQMELESRSITDAFRGPEGREGVQAFLEKRKPDFASAKG